MNGTEERMNRKKQYSRKMIREAFAELLETTPLDRITVRALCEKADVNRTTFYANYEDIFALRRELHNEYATLLMPVYDKYAEMEERAYYQEHFRLLKENRWLCRTVFLMNDKEFFNQFSQIMYDQVIRPRKEKLSPEHAEYLDLIFDFLLAGETSLVRRWVLDGMKMPEDRLADYLCELSTRCVGMMDEKGVYKKIYKSGKQAL